MTTMANIDRHMPHPSGCTSPIRFQRKRRLLLYLAHSSLIDSTSM